MANDVLGPYPPSAPLNPEQVFSSVLLAIRSAQNQDSGWGYRGGASWTEPTAYALLALAAAGETGDAFVPGLAFLERTQRKDGGWSPNASVQQSTWVTALAVLVLAERPSGPSVQRAVRWLLEQSGRESGYFARFRDWLLGIRAEENLSYSGWPWFPGTAAWVAPTALTILAIEKAGRGKPHPAWRERVKSGRQFLMSRMCSDGGWNHGVTKSLGFESTSYPETTGLALLALAGDRGLSLGKSLSRAEQLLESCRSTEGRSWLEIALLAHGRKPPSEAPAAPAIRSIIDRALFVLAHAARHGRNVFLS